MSGCFAVVDAFTDKPFRGNLTAVCVCPNRRGSLDEDCGGRVLFFR